MPRPRPNGNNNLPGKPPICPPLGGRLFRRGMRSPRPTSQFYRNLSSRVPILSMCARGAHSVFIIYYLLSIIYFAPQGHSRPRWCTDPQHPGKLQQKNSLTFSVRLYFGAPSGTRTQDPLIKSQLLSQMAKTNGVIITPHEDHLPSETADKFLSHES